MNSSQPATLLVVDDAPEMIDLLGSILRPHYQIKFANSGINALSIVRNTPPSLILLDIMMPTMSGHELCRILKSDPHTREIPIIFITACGGSANEQLGLELGAVDYLHKPLVPALVLQRIRIHLELRNQNLSLEAKVEKRTQELEQTRMEIIRRLGIAGEFRDSDIGLHVMRMCSIVKQLALAAGLPDAQAELLNQSVPLHDLGKIGIPDRILLKTGSLTDEEWAIMKTHTMIGAEIIGHHDIPLLQTARTVALTHHEQWNGGGYPYGLSGEAIPLEGRIVAIADVFDALTCARPFRSTPWSTKDALVYIANQAGQAFDPDLTSLFIELKPELNPLYCETPSSTLTKAT